MTAKFKQGTNQQVIARISLCRDAVGRGPVLARLRQLQRIRRLGAARHPHPPLYYCNTLRMRAAAPPVLLPLPCPNAWPAPADVHAPQRLKCLRAQAAELPAVCAELRARLLEHEAKRRFAPS